MAFAKERKEFDKYMKELNGELPECSKCPFKPKQHLIPVKWIMCIPCSSFKTNRYYEKKKKNS